MATVASISIISSLGLTYLLDKYKDKQDKNLREEIKDRVSSTLDDLRKKINDLETSQNQLRAQLVTKDQIESIIDEKIKKITDKAHVNEVTQKALNLKVRQPNQRFMENSSPHFSFDAHNTANTQGGENQDMVVKELREMKESIN